MPESVNWQQLLSLLPMIPAAIRGGGVGMGSFAEGYTRGRTVYDEMQQRERQVKLREQAEQYAQSRDVLADQRYEQERQEAQRERWLKILQALPSLRDEALTIAERSGAILPEQAAAHAQQTMGEWMGAIKRLVPDAGVDPTALDRLATVTPAYASRRLATAILPTYEKLVAGADEATLQRLRENPAPIAGWPYPFAELERIVGMSGHPAPKGYSPGSFEQYVFSKYGSNPTPDQVLQARKVYQQIDDRPRVSVNLGGGPQSTGALTPEGVDYAATAYRVTGIMPPMGMGNSQARAAIINAAAEQARLLKQAPAVAIQKQAAYKADTAALQRMRTMSAAAAAFENKAIAQADIVKDLSGRVSRTQIPLLNRAILEGKRELLGDPNTQLLYNAITTFTAEYSKIIEGSTGSVAASSDASRRAAAELAKASLNPETLAKSVDLMKREMALTIAGYDATIDQITSRMGGVPTEPASVPTRGKKVGRFEILEVK